MGKMIYALKYWFAVGYHHGISNIIEPPKPETISYFKEIYDANISEEYEKGRKAGVHDKSRGYD
jgi:hypothetical protein